MVDNNDSVQLSGYCFGACEVLKTVVQGRNTDDLSEYGRMELEDLERCVVSPQAFLLSQSNSRVLSRIERALRRGANIPHAGYNKDEVEGYKLEIQGIVGTLNVPFDENPTMDESGPQPSPCDPHDAAVNSVSGRGTSSAPPSPVLCGILIAPASSTFNIPARGRLIRRAFAPDELPCLIEAIFSSNDEGDVVRGLLGDDIQTFIDVAAEACCTLATAKPLIEININAFC